MGTLGSGLHKFIKYEINDFTIKSNTEIDKNVKLRSPDPLSFPKLSLTVILKN